MVDAIANNPDLQDALRLTADIVDTTEAVETGPLYKVIGDSKIPVAKDTGRLWESRKNQAAAGRSDIENCWAEAIRYYENDQMSHRKDSQSTNGKVGAARYGRKTIGDKWTSTENIVFSNAVTMLPLLYAKNPTIEATPLNGEANAPFATACEALINALFNMKDAPGLNFKNKARRGVLGAYLMNSAYIQVDFIKKQDSSQEAQNELVKLSGELEKAKDQKTIKEVEGKIQALLDKVSFLSPPGPCTRLRSTFSVYVDPTSTEPDHSDASWLTYYDFIPTAYLQAVYGEKKDGQYVSVYEPTHVLRAGGDLNNIEDEVNNFTLFTGKTEDNGKAYGYTNEAAYKAAQQTKVWYVWDKTTRRVLLFADNNWNWPLWVWDDPLKLLRFFPLHRLHFHETPDGSQPKGEVTYYLDQQDEINDIHSSIAQARNWAKSNVFFNKNVISQDDVEKVLKGPDGTARGVNVPEGMKMADVIFSMPSPALAYPELLSTDKTIASINRVTGLNDAQRGAQFKTNTTNDAVDAYQKNVDIRVDEKVDAIEDWIGDIGWSIIQLCAQNWSVEDVTNIIGAEKAVGWKRVDDVSQLRTMLNLRVVGGSTEKPTSKAKKQEALQMGQILGQFASGSPAVILVALKVLQRAFNNEVVITEKDWEMIIGSIEQQMQPKEGAPPVDGTAQQTEPPSEVPPEARQQLEQLVRSLPPEAKQQMDQLIQQGASPSEALKTVMQSQQQPPQ